MMENQKSKIKNQKLQTKYLGALLVLVLLSLTLLPVTSLFAAGSNFNKQVNYQGKLTNSSGVTVTDGDYTMVFKLYTVSSGGSAIWTETRSGGNVVAVANGLFSVLLGSVTDISGVDWNQTLYLGVEVNSDGEMTPRKLLGTVPAAFEADRIDGLDSSQLVRNDATNTISTSSMATILALSQLGAGSIFSAANTGGTVLTVTNSGNLGIGTTTPNWTLQVASVTPYVSITDTDAGTDQKHYLLSNIGGIFRIGTSSDSLSSTSTLLSMDTNGVNGTTTFAQSIRVQGTGTSTFTNNGINLTAGCFSINGTCVGGATIDGSGAANRVTFWTDGDSLSYDNAFVWDNTNKRLGIGTTSPYAMLSVAGPVVGASFDATTTAGYKQYGQRILFGATSTDWVNPTVGFTAGNLFVGFGAGSSTIPNVISTLGTGNTFVGFWAGQTNTSGYSNTAIG